MEWCSAKIKAEALQRSTSTENYSALVLGPRSAGPRILEAGRRSPKNDHPEIDTRSWYGRVPT